MEKLKKVVIGVSVLVFLICVYAFMLGNEVFAGKFQNEDFAWYFLAKGFFCSFALYLLVRILETVSERK